MTIKEFQRLLDLHGGDRRLWPPALRDDADALLAGGGAAAEMMAEAQALDRLLEAATDAQPRPGLAADIMAMAAATPQNTAPATSRLPTRPILGGLAGLAASALLGFVVGWSGLILPGSASADLSDQFFGTVYSEEGEL